MGPLDREHPVPGQRLKAEHGRETLLGFVELYLNLCLSQLETDS